MTRLLDVNDDGTKEFCFVAKPFERPEQLLAAYAVREGKFDPVIAERTTHFTVAFEETTLSSGLRLQPQHKGRYLLQTEKLCEIPVRITNRSPKPVDLRNRYLRLAPSAFSGTYFLSRFTTNALAPGDTVETIVTLRFDQAPPADHKFGFDVIQLGFDMMKYGRKKP